MKVLTTAGLTKLIQLCKSAFVDKTDVVETQTVTLATVATSGSYNDLSNKPTIPTVNNSTITFTQGGVTKGSFTLNQASGDTIALDAGGGGGSSYTAGTGIDITNDVISVTSPTLTNNTSKGLSILGTSSNTYNSTSIGKYAEATGMGSVAISDSYGTAVASGTYSTCVGGDSSVTGTGATAYGNHAKATANYAIQIGYGTNSEANSFYAATSSSNNWKLLGSDGVIPAGRLNIVSSVTSASTNSEMVGAKLFYDTCGDIETLINAL